jgi:hypothetical protein
MGNYVFLYLRPASEPKLEIEDLPYYFADTATKSGMSGFN